MHKERRAYAYGAYIFRNSEISCNIHNTNVHVCIHVLRKRASRTRLSHAIVFNTISPARDTTQFAYAKSGSI